MNPLLEIFQTPFETPPFNLIKNEHFLPAIKKAIEDGKAEVQSIIDNAAVPNFENTIEALEKSGNLVGRISSIFFNLNSAETNEELQTLAREISPLLSDYSNDIILNENLFQKVRAIHEKRKSLTLTEEEKTLLDKTFKAFVRNGVSLDSKNKEILRDIDKQLSQLSLVFGENVLKETNSFQMEITNPSDLVGLPEHVKEAAALTAKEIGKENSWIFTLQYPSYIPFMTYSAMPELREKMFKASGSKAFKGDEQDNQKIVLDIVRLRQKRAELLGYKSHAHFVLEERMAESPEKVQEFLQELLRYAKPIAEKEVNQLADYAHSLGGPAKLEKWDVGYFSEKLKMEKYSIDDEMLKPYFKLEQVMQGVFLIAEKLYGLKFKEINNVQVYHPDVKVYEVLNELNQHKAVFYTDFFPRPGKRNGAWMTSFRGQKKSKGKDIRPHIAIVCNFTKPTETKPSLLTFNEVTTLFHEFGHALHGMLAEGNYESLSGTSVYWDFVELPSQIMENWAYEKESLDLFASHYQDGSPLPIDYISKIKESANFMEAYQTVRQVSLAMLDLGWHTAKAITATDVNDFEKELLKSTDLLPIVPGTNTSCSFSHIFQGGYSSGYYSYKWAEVLDADAFEFFQEKGIFNRETADLFRQHILSAGGSEHPMTLYKRFRGKEPSPEALFKRTGMLHK